MSKEFGTGFSPFGGGGNAEYEEEMYGKVDVPDSGRMKPKVISISEIYPDPLQPRHIIPSVVKRSLNYAGQPELMPKVLVGWQAEAQKQSGMQLNVSEYLRKGLPDLLGGYYDDEGDEKRKPPAILVGFIELIKLAISIKEDGLQHPIAVSQNDNGTYKVVLGERRLLAHHLLKMYVDGTKYGKINANITDYDVWAQASENGVRVDLNAVQKCRQVLALIMALYEYKEDFANYEECLVNGSDRRYWNQVANGNRFKLSPDQYERIYAHTNLQSTAQISQFRRIARDLNDEEWIIADDEDWSENAIREYIQSKNKPERLTVVNPSESLTTVKVQPPARPIDEDEYEDDAFDFDADEVVRGVAGGFDVTDRVYSRVGDDPKFIDVGERPSAYPDYVKPEKKEREYMAGDDPVFAHPELDYFLRTVGDLALKEKDNSELYHLLNWFRIVKPSVMVTVCKREAIPQEYVANKADAMLDGLEAMMHKYMDALHAHIKRLIETQCGPPDDEIGLDDV